MIDCVMVFMNARKSATGSFCVEVQTIDKGFVLNQIKSMYQLSHYPSSVNPLIQCSMRVAIFKLLL
jgi:hypothetical protein